MIALHLSCVSSSHSVENYNHGIIDDLHVSLTFNLGKKNKIFYYSEKEHPKISRIANFGGEMLKNMENIASQSLQICIYFCYARKKLPFLRLFQLNISPPNLAILLILVKDFVRLAQIGS